MKKTILLSAALACAACSTPIATPEPDAGVVTPGPTAFTHRVDRSLAATLPSGDPRDLSSARTASGAVHLFIKDQLLLATSDRAQLDALLARVGGTVVGDDAVPQPPAGLSVQLTAADTTPTQYVVRVDLSKADVSALDVDGSQAGLRGEVAFSSDDAVRLLALVAHEKAAGLRASPNFAFQGDLISSSEEHPAGAGFFDAMTQTPFLATGSRSNVVGMWQFVAAFPPARRSTVAIIDSGFWLDGAGRPMSSEMPWVSDFPEAPIQYDFNGDDRFADGPGIGSCSGGSSCPWHGNGAAAVAVGTFNNRYGGAGTGGQTADPMLFRTSLDWGQVSRAIRTAAAWRADVISMSFGASCDNAFCDLFFETNLYPALRNARDNGVVMVAAAGNESESANGKVPCKAAEDVICVGALEDGTTNAIWYSNSGSSVAVWGPTNIAAQPDLQTTPNLKSFGGTSATTPFVAGVAAVMRAYDRTLTSAQVKSIMRRTAYTGSSDSKVTHVLDAYRSVRETAGARNAAPDVRIVVDTANVQVGVGAQVRVVTLDLEDGSPCCTVTWSPSADSLADNGRRAVFTFTSAGEHRLTATATDSGGVSTTTFIDVTARNTPPVVEIFAPGFSGSHLAGQPVQLSGRATDPNEAMGLVPCTQLRWSSNVLTDPGFPLIGCDGMVTFPSAGTRTLTLVATDSQGVATSAARSITVNAAPVNYPPTVTVGALPATSYSGGYGSDVPFQVSASATDPEGNTPLTYRWFATIYAPGSTTSISSARAQLSSSTVTGNLSWTPDTTAARFETFGTVGNNCYMGQSVKLDLEVTDSLGNRTTRTLPVIKVYVCRII